MSTPADTVVVHVPTVVGWTFFIAIVAIVFFLWGWSRGRDEGELQMNREAVKRGSAHWGLYPDGSPAFIWNVPCQGAIE